MTTLAVFRSRAQTLEYISFLKASGVPTQAVNTPKEAGVGCGISAQFDSNFLPRAKSCLKIKPFSSFSGFLARRGNGYFSVK